MTLPTGWIKVPLGTVCRVVEGQVDPRKAQYRDLPHINGEVIESGTGRILDLNTAAQDGLISGKYLFEPGMVLYSKLRPYLRKATIAPSRGVCSADMYPLTFDPLRVDTRFAMFSLLADPFTRYAVEQSQRARMPKLNRAQLLAWEMPLPASVDVQRRIAAHLIEELAAAEAAKRAAEERLDAADALTAAFANEIFDRQPADSWAERTLGELVLGAGQYGTSQRSNSEGRGLPVLGMPNIHNGRIRWHSVATVDLPVPEAEKYELKSGDILFNRTNSAELVGKTAVFDGSRRAVFASYLVRYRANSDLADPHFLSAYINSRRGRVFIEQHMARAIGQVNISASTMHRMPVPCPPVEAQRQLMKSLSRRLSGVQGLVELCQEQLGQLEAIPGVVLRAAFQGES